MEDRILDTDENLMLDFRVCQCCFSTRTVVGWPTRSGTAFLLSLESLPVERSTRLHRRQRVAFEVRPPTFSDTTFIPMFHTGDQPFLTSHDDAVEDDVAEAFRFHFCKLRVLVTQST